MQQTRSSRSYQLNPLAKLTRSLSVDSFMDVVKSHKQNKVQQDQQDVSMIQQDLDLMALDNMQQVHGEPFQKERGLPAACLFIAHLEANVADALLHNSLFEMLKQFGFIIDLQVHRDQKYRPYAFCQFRHQQDAERALEKAQNTLLYGRPIRLEKARVNRTIFISKMERDLSEYQIKEILSQYGQLEEIKLLRDDSGHFKGCVFCRYCYREDAIAAVLALETFDWKIEWVNNQTKTSPATAVEKDSLYIGKLPLKVTENDLYTRFSRYGTITALNLVRRSAGIRVPGGSNYAFLTYSSPEAASAAIDVENGSPWLDHHIEVAHRLSTNGLGGGSRPPALYRLPKRPLGSTLRSPF